MQGTSGALPQVARGNHPGLLISIRSQRSPWWRTHLPPEAAFQTQACCCQRDASIPYAFHNEHAACRLTSRREQAGRGRPVLRSRVRALRRAFTIRNMPDAARTFCAHSRPILTRYKCQLHMGWARLARADARSIEWSWAYLQYEFHGGALPGSGADRPRPPELKSRFGFRNSIYY